MARRKYFLGALLVTLGIAPLLMGPSGGLPSRPTFQLVTATSSVSGNTLHRECNTSNGLGLKCWGLRVGSTGSWALTPETDAFALGTTNALVIAKNSSQAITSLDLGNATDKPSITLNGAAVPTKYSYGMIQGGGSSCTVLAASSAQTANLSGCVRNAAGDYTVSFSSAYTTNPPLCTITQAGGTLISSVTLAATGSVRTQTWNTSGTQTDPANIILSCIGT